MKYTQEQISTALVLLKATGVPDKVIKTLGYPSLPILYHWRKKYSEYYDVPNQNHWRQAPTELKHDVIKRYLIKGKPVKLVAKEIGYTPSLIYKWIREYQEKGGFQPMKKTTANINVNPNDITSAEDINELKAQMLDMQMEIDILKETINVLKKAPGIDQTALTNQEKAVIIDALKNKYSCRIFLKNLTLQKAAIIIKKKTFMQKINTLIFAKELYNCFMKIEIYLVIEEFICCFIVKI